jgi:hypothetical protein
VIQIREEEGGGVLVVAPGGRLDSASSGDLETLPRERLDAGTRPEALARMNRELARDNERALFVTALVRTCL